MANDERKSWIYKYAGDYEGRDCYHILIFENGGIVTKSSCIPKNRRKITPEEALSYFKAYFEREGFKEGCKFKSAETKKIHAFNGVEQSLFEWDFISSENNIVGRLFDNKTNTFATLVEEEKLEPLEFKFFHIRKTGVSLYDIEIEHKETGEAFYFTHEQIEQIYQYSLKAQGK